MALCIHQRKDCINPNTQSLSELLFSRGFLHNTLVNRFSELMGSLWAIHVGTDVDAGDYEGGPCEYLHKVPPASTL